MSGAGASQPFACSSRELISIAAAAVIIRMAVFAATCGLHEITPEQFAQLRDGQSYVGLARAMWGDTDGLRRFDWRVFPGYPAAIALLRIVVPSYAWCALIISWFAAAAAAVCSARFFRDCRVGWGMVALFPSHLLFTSMAMSESLMLALTAAALSISFRRPAVSGAMAAAAALVRPQALFAAAARLVTIRSQARFAAGGAIMIVTGAWLYASWTGDLLLPWRVYSSDVRAYGGDGGVFAYPFESLVMTPLRFPVPLWKVLYSWFHVLVAIGACYTAVVAVRRLEGSGEIELTAASWLIGNTAFVSVIGGVWGFEEAHRFILPALPPLLYVTRRWLPQRRSIWIAIAAVSFAAALFAAGHGVERVRPRNSVEETSTAPAFRD